MIFVGKWLGSRHIRCNWATKGATSGDDRQGSDSKSVVELTSGQPGEFMIQTFIYKFYFVYQGYPSSLFLFVCFIWLAVDNHHTLSHAEDGQEKSNEDAPENNSQYTTVYVGKSCTRGKNLVLFTIILLSSLNFFFECVFVW